MKNATLFDVELEIPGFFNVQAVQELFDSFKKPDDQSSTVFNLMKIAEYLQLNDIADTLKQVLVLVDMNMSSRVVNINDELHAICKKFRGYIFQESNSLLGKKLTGYLYVAVGM